MESAIVSVQRNSQQQTNALAIPGQHHVSARGFVAFEAHPSKGKEFDAVIIAEGQYQAALLDPTWSASRSQAARRLLRVAITRARHAVMLVRPPGATPLTG
jgi:DNA helicase-2/ATP-dependent DNA helicase PcrA